MFLIMASRNRYMTCARSRIGHCLQSSKAAIPARTAASTSSAPLIATFAIGLPWRGFSTSSVVLLVRGSTHAPPMKLRAGTNSVKS